MIIVSTILLTGTMIAVSASDKLDRGSVVIYARSSKCLLKAPDPIIVELTNNSEVAKLVWDSPLFEKRLLHKKGLPLPEKRNKPLKRPVWDVFIECWTPDDNVEYGHAGHGEVKEVLIEPGKSALIKVRIPPSFLGKGLCKIVVRVECQSKTLFCSAPLWIECVLE